MLTTIFLLIILAMIGLAGIPLMLGIVPPNPYYGWPARRSSSKPDLWKQVNLFAGRALVVAAGIAALAIMAWNGTWLKSGWAQLFVVLLAVAGAVGATFWYDRKTDR
jgi:uncharacterized membrane protein